MKRQLTALALAGMMTLGLAACGNGDEKKPTDTAADNTPASSMVPGDNQRALAGKDMDGRVFKLASWDAAYMSTKETIVEPDPEVSTDYDIEKMKYDHFMGLLEDYNCDIANVVIDHGQLLDSLATSVMAGDPIGDWITLVNDDVLSAALGNLIVPFNEFLPADHDLFTTKQYTRPVGEVAGKVWTVQPYGLNTDGTFLGVNLDIIRAIGAPNPVELYERGEWTVDNFMEICRLATKDTTGSGSIDQYGISGFSNEIVSGLLAANGVTPVTDDFKFGYDSPQAMYTLETIYQIFAIDRTFNFDPNSGAAFWDFNRNTYAFQEGRSCFFVAAFWIMPDAGDWAFDYTAVPFPKGPSYDGHSFFMSFGMGVGVPRGTINPEDAFLIYEKYWNWYGEDPELLTEGQMLYPYSKFKTEAEAERIMDVLNNQLRFDIGGSVLVDGWGYSWINGTFAHEFYEGYSTPVQMVESGKQRYQDMLDTVLKPLLAAE